MGRRKARSGVLCPDLRRTPAAPPAEIVYVGDRLDNDVGRRCSRRHESRVPASRPVGDHPVGAQDLRPRAPRPPSIRSPVPDWSQRLEERPSPISDASIESRSRNAGDGIANDRSVPVEAVTRDIGERRNGSSTFVGCTLGSARSMRRMRPDPGVEHVRAAPTVAGIDGVIIARIEAGRAQSEPSGPDLAGIALGRRPRPAVLRRCSVRESTTGFRHRWPRRSSRRSIRDGTFDVEVPRLTIRREA